MAATTFTSSLSRKPLETAPNATWGMSLAALALALLIGFGAVHVQQKPAVGTDQTQQSYQGASKLDGRGKWAGYM